MALVARNSFGGSSLAMNASLLSLKLRGSASYTSGLPERGNSLDTGALAGHESVGIAAYPVATFLRTPFWLSPIAVL